MKIMIAGTAGFSGLHAARHLLERQGQVVAADCRPGVLAGQVVARFADGRRSCGRA